MHLTKSPNPDGMSPIFYHKYWDVVGPNVINYVIQTLKIGVMSGGLNETCICLIPKVKCPPKITKFKPSAFETMQRIDQRRKGKKGLMAIKLDMSKT